jgi:hypothetical protein
MSSHDNAAAGAGRQDPAEAVRAALAKALGTEDFDVVAETTARMPSGEEVRLVHGAVRGEPNRTAALAVDSAGTVHPPRRLEALAGRDLFAPEPATATRVPRAGEAGRAAAAPTEPVTVDPPVNEWTLPECVTERETVTVDVPVSGIPPKADVYLLADTTGSMSGIIAAVQAGITAVVNDPAFTGFDVAWGAGNYKDFPPEFSPYAFQHQLSPIAGAADVSLAVAAWSASGGHDTSEGQLFALQQVATDPVIGWRPDSKRIVVWIGDAPGHDPVCAGISGVADITEATATTALVNAGITVVAISTNTGPGLDGDPAADAGDYGVCTVGGSPGQATRIAAATPSGSHTVGIDATQIINTLIPLIKSAVTAIGNVHLQPTGGIAPFVTSITPAGGYGPLPGDVPHSLQFEVTWTGVRDCEDKEQVFTGTLDVVADGVVVANKPVTITVPACRWHHSMEMLCGTEKGRRDGHDDADQCETVVPGRYATAVTIYNPTTCTVTLVKYFAPLVLHGEPVGREPRTVRARPFARIQLKPGEVTMDDCCSLEEAVGPTGGPLLLGVLDIVADHALEVTVTHTATGGGPASPSITARTITPRRA